METHKLSDSAKEKIEKQIGRFSIHGTIEFYDYRNVLVGKSELPEFTSTEQRHIIAEDCGVKSYTDFTFSNGHEIRVFGSKTKFQGLVSEIDVGTDFGEYEGKMYESFKRKKECECCGRNLYEKPSITNP